MNPAVMKDGHPCQNSKKYPISILPDGNVSLRMIIGTNKGIIQRADPYSAVVLIQPWLTSSRISRASRSRPSLNNS